MIKFDNRVNLFDLNNIDKFKDIDFSKINIFGISDFENPEDNTLFFINKPVETLSLDVENCIIIIHYESNIDLLNKNNIIIKSKNPRLDYAMILSFLMNIKSQKEYVSQGNNIYIGKNTFIHPSVIIEPNVFIDENVSIEKDCYIESGARIYSNVKVGSNCRIGANSTIGLTGFGVEIDQDGKSYRIPHLGGVIIGNNVIVSSLCNIHAGTIKPTILEDYVQLDALVHIGHNCIIKKSSMITACAEISGSVVLEEKSYIGPNSSITNKISIGSNSVIGIGAVVTKNIESGVIVAGNPAEKTSILKQKNLILRELIKNNEK